jgi:putative ABC transport system permease protein
MFLTRIFQAVRLARRRGHLNDDVQKELAFHLQMEIDARVRGGMSQAEARRAALLDFGGVDRVQEEVRDVRGATFWDDLRQDLRYGVRMLRRSPGYALAAVLTLGLGIGANAAIFSIVNEVLLAPLPYGNGEELVRIRQAAPRIGRPDTHVAIAEYADYKNTLKTVQDVVEYHAMSFILIDDTGPDRIDAGVVSPHYFDLFRLEPIAGRAFVDADDAPDAEPVLMLSHQYWLKKFRGDDDVVGRLVQLNNRPHRIVGVLPPIPQYPVENDVYMPTSACPFRARAASTMEYGRRTFSSLHVFARLRPGHNESDAGAEVATLARAWASAEPSVYRPGETGFAADVVRLDDELTVNARPILLSLFGATGLVLLISCANVANLSLARTFRRAREIAVRSALGAGRGRLARQLVVESTLVGLAGGVVGLVVAWSSAGLLAAFASLFTQRVVDASLDVNVLWFTLAISIATGLLFGLAPAATVRTVLTEALKDGAPQVGHGFRSRRLRSALVVGQVTVCFVLVVGAGLLLRSLHRLTSVDLGFEPRQVLTAEVYSNWSHQTNERELLNFYAAVLEKVRAIPGVRAAAITNAVPLGNIVPGERPIRIAGVSPDTSDPSTLPPADQNLASDQYFETLGVPVIRGREIAATDRAGSTPVAVINETMAKLWGDRDPIGGRFRIETLEPFEFTVVGIVKDFRQYGVDRPAIAQYYTPVAQSLGLGGRLLVRTEERALAFGPAVTAAVAAVDPHVPVEDIQTLDALRAGQLLSTRLVTALLAVFAVIALVITITGLAAVIATSVSQRTREFGLRMALGASAATVIRMVVRQGVRLVALGLIAGAAGALTFGRLFGRFLYETQPTDLPVLGGVAALLLTAAVLACLVPARRATGIDPLIALKTE